MSEESFLGRQPILDARGALVAFELLYRSGPQAGSGAGCGCNARPCQASTRAQPFDNLRASSQVIASVIGEIGLADSLGAHLGYVNADHDLLMSDVVALLSPERFVLEVLETTLVDKALRERLVELRRLGYRIALDDVIDSRDERLALLPLIDIVKVELLPGEPAGWLKLARELAPSGKTLLAEKVETPRQFELARKAGFDLFQGYFFSEPQLLRSRRGSISASEVMRLLMVLDEDRGIDALAAELARQPVLTTRLLRLVNSGASGLRREVDSIGAAIMLIGTRQIGRWAQLLLYADSGEHPAHADPLVQQVGTRARMMELVARIWRPEDARLADQAFMTGMLSKIDVLLGKPRHEILKDLPLSPALREALSGQQGELGRLLKLCEARERVDRAGLRTLCNEMTGLSPADIALAEFQAAGWTLSLTGSA